MSFMRWVAGLAPVFVATACSVLPMPEDVTNVPTEKIVQHIRCETREAVIDAVLGYLSYMESRKDLTATEAMEFSGIDAYKKTSKDDYSTILYIYDIILKKTTADVTRFDKTLLRYAASSIAFEFKLDMAASDNSTLSSGLAHPFTNGSFSLGMTSTGNFARENLVDFRVSDEFGKLISTQTDQQCMDPPIINSFYPVVGKIGISKIINLAVYLNENEDLDKLADKDTTKTVSAQIKFTTTVSQQVDPKLGINTTGHFVQLTAIELNSTLSRTDTDTVIVGFAVPLTDPVIPKPPPPGAKTPKAAAPKLPTASSNTKKAAFTAIDDLKATINGTNFANVVKQLNGP